VRSSSKALRLCLCCLDRVVILLFRIATLYSSVVEDLLARGVSCKWLEVLRRVFFKLLQSCIKIGIPKGIGDWISLGVGEPV